MKRRKQFEPKGIGIMINPSANDGVDVGNLSGMIKMLWIPSPLTWSLWTLSSTIQLRRQLLMTTMTRLRNFMFVDKLCLHLRVRLERGKTPSWRPHQLLHVHHQISRRNMYKLSISNKISRHYTLMNACTYNRLPQENTVPLYHARVVPKDANVMPCLNHTYYAL